MNSKVPLIGLLATALACRSAALVNAAPPDDAGSAVTPGSGDATDAGTTNGDAGATEFPVIDAGVVDGGSAAWAPPVIPPFPGVQATLVADGPVWELLVAPDGEHVLFVKEQRYTNCRSALGRSALLWLADAKGGTPTLVNDASRYSFSAGGSRFALITTDCEDHGNLVSYHADGTGATAVTYYASAITYSGEILYGGSMRLAPSDDAPVQLAWPLRSSDPLGEAAYSCDSSTQRCLYYPSATDPTSAVALDTSRAGTAEWTPDGAWMVLADIAVSRDGSRQQRVGGTCMESERLTPDGRAVVFARLPTGPGCDGAFVIHPLDGSPEAVTGPLPSRLQGPDYWSNWALSDDGTQLLVSYYSPITYAQGVLVAPASGGPLEDLLPESNSEFTLAPDGSLYALEGAWPAFSMVHRQPGAPPETVMSGTDCLPVTSASSGKLLVLEENRSGSPSSLHLLSAGTAWPGVTLPGSAACFRRDPYAYKPFNFGFAGNTPLYVTRGDLGQDELVAVSDSGIAGVLAKQIWMFRVAGSAVYVVAGTNRDLWRIAIPQQ